MPRTFVWHRTKGPKKTEPNTLTAGQVLIEQVRSGIGKTARMRANLEALGLRHHQDVVVKTDSPSLRGQLLRVRHLVTVTAVTEKAEKALKAEKAAAGAEKAVKAEKAAPAAKSEKAEKPAAKSVKAEKAERKEK